MTFYLLGLTTGGLGLLVAIAAFVSGDRSLRSVLRVLRAVRRVLR